MTLPSSPPLLPSCSLDELPSSPPLPPATPSSSSSLAWISAPRKRQLSEHDTTLSSDPLFSDDTLGSEDADGYKRPKRKRMVKGPWWELGRKGSRNETTPKQSDYTRNIDSGVWMGSDGSESSAESVSGSQHEMGRLNVNDRPRSVRTPKAIPPRPSPQAVAADTVNRCVEEGIQRVDLSQLGLVELLPSTLQPLHELIRQPTFDPSLPPSDDDFGPLTPDIQLFLSTNHLRALPDALFRLENITVLSVRNNALLELPSAITRLKRLEELNVANNAIRYLPWELLDILQSRHTRVILHPNPFVEPLQDFAESAPSPASTQLHSNRSMHLEHCVDHRSCIAATRDRCASDGTLDMRTELELLLQLGHALGYQHHQTTAGSPGASKRREGLVYLASTAVQYYDIDGRPHPASASPDFHCTMSTAPTRRPLEEAARNRVPSLFELSLKRVRQRFDLSRIPDGLPSQVQTALRAAQTIDSDQTCSSCRRNYVIPRARWIEYWHHGLSPRLELSQESVLPFVRQVCSWACAEPTEDGTFRAFG